jgi:hypothetical protein
MVTDITPELFRLGRTSEVASTCLIDARIVEEPEATVVRFKVRIIFAGGNADCDTQ